MSADTRFRGENKPKLPLPKPPPPNPLAHNRQPKVRFSIAEDAPILQSGGSSYQLPGERPSLGCVCDSPKSHLRRTSRQICGFFLLRILECAVCVFNAQLCGSKHKL